MAREHVEVLDKLIELDRTSPRNILVIGDRMTDVYVQGRLDERCQEGCKKFVEESRVVVPGGAANAARSLERWSCTTVCMGEMGQGCVKTRFMEGQRCVWRCDRDYDQKIDFEWFRKENSRILQTQHYSAVLLSDYDKGLLTPSFIKHIVATCKEQNIPCVADCKRAPEAYHGCILKGNTEWTARYGMNEGVSTHRHCNPCIWGSGVPWGLGYDLPPVKCVNHVGAGDCFAAHLTLGLSYGLSLRESAMVAHSAGRVYVQYPYNRPPWIEEIRADLEG